MKTFAFPVIFFVEAETEAEANATLAGNLGYLEDNSALRTYADNSGKAIGEVNYTWQE